MATIAQLGRSGARRVSDGLRLADVRFLLPTMPATAGVHGVADGWPQALSAVGIDVRPGLTAPDVAVCSPGRVRTALADRPGCVVVPASSSARALRRAGYQVRRVLAVPGPVGPVHLVPLGDARAARAAFARVGPAWSLGERLRDGVVPAVVGAGLALPRHTVTLGLSTDAPPLLLSLAAEYGVPVDASWWLSLGRGDVLQRGLLHVVTDTRGSGFVVKFGRVAGYLEPFDRDVRGLKLAAAAGGAAAGHVTGLVARFEARGHPVVVETRAPGRPLDEVLRSRLPMATRTAFVEDVADWLVRVGAETAQSPAALAAERRRLARDVLPVGADAGTPPELVSALPPVPGVLVHDDLGCWNVLHDGQDFTVVDWESARRPGLPLWDLLYFLADALVTLAGEAAPADPVAATVALFRGELPTSRVLFRWVRRVVTDLSVPAHAVGAIATLAWLHHARSARLRKEALLAAGSATTSAPATLSAVAWPWLRDPALGPGWSSWQ